MGVYWCTGWITNTYNPAGLGAKVLGTAYSVDYYIVPWLSICMCRIGCGVGLVSSAISKVPEVTGEITGLGIRSFGEGHWLLGVVGARADGEGAS